MVFWLIPLLLSNLVGVGLLAGGLLLFFYLFKTLFLGTLISGALIFVALAVVYYAFKKFSQNKFDQQQASFTLVVFLLLMGLAFALPSLHLPFLQSTMPLNSLVQTTTPTASQAGVELNQAIELIKPYLVIGAFLGLIAFVTYAFKNKRR